MEMHGAVWADLTLADTLAISIDRCASVPVWAEHALDIQTNSLIFLFYFILLGGN